VDFVKTLMVPHLLSFNIHAYPTRLKTKSGEKGGGNVTIDRIAKHLQIEYHRADFLTTFVDFYCFRNKGDLTKEALEKAIVDAAAANRINKFDSRRIIPYVQMHEFEALIFSDVSKFSSVLLDEWNESIAKELKRVADSYTSPEDINDDPQTAPSKRLLKIFKKGRYNKTVHGPIIAEKIGLPTIRGACPKFNAWLTSLEQIGTAP
jgi:hypothetical protein